MSQKQSLFVIASYFKIYSKPEVSARYLMFKKVVITFFGTSKDEPLHQEIYKIAETGGSFDFLNALDEDIYSDADLKLKV
ncbi:MAG: hypothetical protein Q7J76_09315 [Candidatus Brocadiaceae bacterium]|uniref:hypothetical protein n=1 Tax=Candidatus Wunengus sp. YC61 TaxID=3367698 RepID=UPI0027200E16|nr:hypothetical protein [Candidatus Brocadiaceae bacterium]